MIQHDRQQERVALYARISTGEGMQAEGHSIEAQLAEMHEFAAQRGWEVVAKFVDVGISGSHEQRPQLQALLAAVAEGVFDIVLVHELSRLSRSVYGTFDILERLGDYEIGFASVTDRDFDYTSPTGRLFLTFMAALNQYYLDQMRMHIRKSKKQRVREGLYNASIPPLGYQHVGDARTPPETVPEDAKIVKLIFEKYATGQYSYQKVADYLNAHGYTSRQDNPFSKDTVADIIRNPFYKGKVRYREGRRDQERDMIKAGHHEALVSEALWEACRQVRQQHQNVSRPFQAQVRTYLLGQLLHCHVCNRRLRSQYASGNVYYREMSNARGYHDCPNARIGARGEALHAQMHALVRALHLPEDWQVEIREELGKDEAAVKLRRQRQRLVAERRSLLLDRQRGYYDDDDDLFHRRFERLKSELQLLPSPVELERLEQAALKLAYLHEVWDKADVEDQHELLQLMFRRVTVDVDQRRLVMLYPTAPFIPLFRNLAQVVERDLGAFAPLWTPEEVAPLGVAHTQLAPLQALPELPVELPFLPEYPWPPQPRSRITPAVSDVLKARRQAGYEGGLVLDVRVPGLAPLRVDGRQWPEVTLEQVTLAEALAERETEVACLHTSFQVQRHPQREELLESIYERLGPHGTWYWVDVLPQAMPAHWLFRYFPETWAYAQERYWSGYRIYNRLKEAGFGVEQVEQQERTVYQPVPASVAYAMAAQRPGLLQALPDGLYQAGLERLAAEEPDALLSSETTLVVVAARKAAS